MDESLAFVEAPGTFLIAKGMGETAVSPSPLIVPFASRLKRALA